MSACLERTGAQFVYQNLATMGSFLGGAGMALEGAAAIPLLPLQVRAGLAATGAVAGGISYVAGLAEDHYRSKYDSLEDACNQEKNENSDTVPKVEAPIRGGGGGGGGSMYAGYAPGPSFQMTWVPGSHSGSGGTSTVIAGQWVIKLVPITLDLDHDGNTFSGVSTHYADITMDGRIDTYRLPDARDGVLVYDYNQDGIGQVSEWALTSFVPGASTDYEALQAFNSDGSSRFDGGDQEFHKFKVGIDYNGNGIFDQGELRELSEFGIDGFALTNVAQNLNYELDTGITLQDEGWVKDQNNDQFFIYQGISLDVDTTYNQVHTDSNASVINSGNGNMLVWHGSSAALVNMSTLNYGGYGSFSDAIMGNGNDQVYGTESNNIISGGGGADVLLGNGGDDVIIADWADLNYGSVNGGVGQDVLAMTEAAGFTINLAALGFEGFVGSSSDDVVSATGLATSFIATAGGNDTLLGGDGADFLDGGTGSDWLSGGAGDDVYIFGKPANIETIPVEHDVISDTAGFDSVVFTSRTIGDVSQVTYNNSNMLLSFVDGSSLTIINQAFADQGVEEINFSGVLFSRSDLESLVQI